MKIVVINSTGPMGASVLGSLIEKFGYLVLPIRNKGMNKYLISRRKKELDEFKENLVKVIKRHGDHMIKSGGVNMIDRDSSPPYMILNKKPVEDDLALFEKKEHTTVSQIYEEFREIYAKSLIYKKSYHDKGKHVEYTTYFDTYDTEKLSEVYKQEFGDVLFIHLHRDFTDWVESIVSQRFSKPDKFKLILLHGFYNRFINYEKKSRRCPGMHVNFTSIFEPNTSKLIGDLSKTLGDDKPRVNWKKEQYDLYGRLRDYDTTFNIADTPGKYLSAMTLSFVDYCSKKKKITRLDDILFFAMYLFDLVVFLIKKKKTS